MQNDATERHTSLYDRADSAAPIRRGVSGVIDTDHYVRRARRLRARHVHGMQRKFIRYMGGKLSLFPGVISKPDGGTVSRKCRTRGWSSCHD